MDFQTIDYKLVASNPSKPDLSVPSHMRYYSVMEFFADIKLTFDNCYTFNGADHLVSQCARRLQALLDKSSKNMPPPQAVSYTFIFRVSDYDQMRSGLALSLSRL